MHDGPTPTKFGRHASPAPLQLHRLHIPGPAPLREVMHEVPIPVLDQEDLHKQGIDVTQLMPGAQDVDALGSCTCNAGTAHLAERMTAAGKPLHDAYLQPGDHGAMLTADARTAEEFAIVLYHLVTGQTGDPAQEWPPSDAGSSGYYVCHELERLGLASSYKTGAGVLGALSLLQAGTVMQGAPWFRAWFQLDSQGFIDGDGSADAMQAAVASGVAGGHETQLRGIEQLAVLGNGTVDLQNTVLRVRNSWSPQWGLGGDYRIHASTLGYLSAYCDWKAIII